MKWFRNVVIGVLVLFFASANARAQSTISGYITGVVTDPSKGAVVGAKVELASTETRLPRVQ
jgi:hypothetical protein